MKTNFTPQTNTNKSQTTVTVDENMSKIMARQGFVIVKRVQTTCKLCGKKVAEDGMAWHMKAQHPWD